MQRKEIKKEVDRDLDCCLGTTQTVIDCAVQLIDMKFRKKIVLGPKDLIEVKDFLNKSCARLQYIRDEYKLVKKK